MPPNKNLDNSNIVVGNFSESNRLSGRLRQILRLGRLQIIIVVLVVILGGGGAIAANYTSLLRLVGGSAKQSKKSISYTHSIGTKPVTATTNNGSVSTSPPSSASKTLNSNGPSTQPPSSTSQPQSSSSTNGSSGSSVSVSGSSGATGGTNGGSSGGNSSPVPLGVSGSWTLKFDDEFNATSLNQTTWSPDWFGNGNTQNGTTMLSSDVSESGGYLNLLANSSGGGLVSTNPSDGQAGHSGYQFTYGYLEARINLPASGNQVANWPAFWADGQSWPTDGELDVIEGLGGSACYHFHDPSGGPGGCASGNYTGWHTYGAKWENGSVTYYYDGTQVGQITSGITSAPMYIILENSTGSYGGPSVLPATMQVDYVRVWQ